VFGERVGEARPVSLQASAYEMVAGGEGLLFDGMAELTAHARDEKCAHSFRLASL
jgi:hypothetical protein